MLRPALSVLALLAAAPAAAQLLPPPVGAAAAPATGVKADPNRVFGDDAPAASGFDILGGIGLDIGADLVTEWSDNFAREDEGQPLSPQFESRSDFRFTPSVFVNAGRAFGRQTVFLNAGVGRDIYARNTSLNKSRLNIDGGVGWTLGTRCTGRVQGGWNKRGTQFNSFEEVVPSTQERTSFFASAACRTPGGLAPNISYDRYKVTNNVDDAFVGIVGDRSFADVKSQGVNGGIGYTLASRGEVGVQGQWRDLKYPNQPLVSGGSNSSELWGANGYINYRIGPSLRANGTLGFTKVNPGSPLSPSFSGTTWSIGLNYIGPRLGASVGTGRSVSGSSGGTGNYQIGKFINASVSYQTGTRITASAGYSHSDTQYVGTGEVPESQVLNSTKGDRFFIGADYRLNRILSFGLDLNHKRRSSDPGTFSYNATSVILAVRARI